MVRLKQKTQVIFSWYLTNQQNTLNILEHKKILGN